ncbi:uncharacterized protein LOC122857868 [Aphidius gifuensis]|uniref:uncharacterized protein LOC122857868 n=1 Tax=Aphidius gifuensis TaxID=684658 RepID=UPI001CDB7622|nr:uncharacterized protein LOC122857868 [Aphidius gifuensis]
MNTNQSKINMETAELSPTEWLEKFIIISKKELELTRKSLGNRPVVTIVDDSDDDDDDYDYDDNDDHDARLYNNDNDHPHDHHDHYDKAFDDNDDSNSDSDSDDLENTDDNKIRYSEIRKAPRYNSRMILMAPLFSSQPRLEKICEDWENSFLRSCFTRYTFNSNKKDSVNELHEKVNDLKYLMNLCGSNLTSLDVTQYPSSQIMPIINANCPNLEMLYLGFKEIISQDFENVFSNMSHLMYLTIKWQCENSTLPMTLANSLEQIGGTLKILNLYCTLKENNIFSPDSLASVFPRLTALDCLQIRCFGLSQLLLQSIGEMKNLTDLRLYSFWPKNHPMFDTRINMYPIGNLKNLEKLWVDCDYGVRDEFLINLCNNAKKLTLLHIIGTYITDIGMRAINNLQELGNFNLGVSGYGSRSEKNEFITDESIQCLFNQKLYSLNISNCIKITDKGAIKLVENLPSLIGLFVKNTKITRGAVSRMYKLSKHGKKGLLII